MGMRRASLPGEPGNCVKSRFKARMASLICPAISRPVVGHVFRRVHHGPEKFMDVIDPGALEISGKRLGIGCFRPRREALSLE